MPRHPAVHIAALIVATVVAAACAGEGPSEAERATQLAAAYEADSNRLTELRASRDELLMRMEEFAPVLPEAREYAERLQRAMDASVRATTAGAGRRYGEIPAIAAAGIGAADSVGRDALDRSVRALDESSRLLDADKSGSARQMEAVDRAMNAGKVASLFTGIATEFRNFLINEVARLITLGPADVRPVAFDTMAELHVRMKAGREIQGLDSLLRAGYGSEIDRANRARMAATMDRLAISVEAPPRPR